MDSVHLTELIALRRDLHRHPELRFAERRTSALLANHLAGLGLEVSTQVAKTAVVGTIDSGRPGPHIVLRADMDALSTTDLKSVEYASATPGVAHACGHDVHCVAVLGATALLLRGGALAGGGRLTVLFQPAEEIPFGETSGAQTVLDSGALDDPRVDAVLALHCWPQLPSGTIGVDSVTAMAAKLAFKISVQGNGAHAATPQLGRDALLGASQIIVALHTLLGREVDPADQVALNIGTLRSGSSQSIVPSQAELSGTLRTLSDPVVRRLKESIERVASGVAATYNLTTTVDWKNEMPSVRNDPRLVELAHRELASCEGVTEVLTLPDPPMTSDDFALYAQRWPGLYLKLGVADPAASSWPSLHDGAFDVDERCIGTGAQALAQVTRAVLRRPVDEAQDDPAERDPGARRKLEGVTW